MNAPNAIQLTTLAALLVTVQAFAGKYDPEPAIPRADRNGERVSHFSRRLGPSCNKTQIFLVCGILDSFSKAGENDTRVDLLGTHMAPHLMEREGSPLITRASGPGGG